MGVDDDKHPRDERTSGLPEAKDLAPARSRQLLGRMIGTARRLCFGSVSGADSRLNVPVIPKTPEDCVGRTFHWGKQAGSNPPITVLGITRRGDVQIRNEEGRKMIILRAEFQGWLDRGILVDEQKLTGAYFGNPETPAPPPPRTRSNSVAVAPHMPPVQLQKVSVPFTKTTIGPPRPKLRQKV